MIEGDNRAPVEIRAATLADLPAITTILRATIQNPYGSGQIDENEVWAELEKIVPALENRSSDQTLLAQDQVGHVTGLAFYGLPDPRITEFTGSDPQQTTELKLLYLDPGQRRQGIGTQLLRAVERSVEESGQSRVELVSGPRYILKGAGRFYEKLGYTLMGTIPNYFDGQYWARVFQKDLS